jgi:uncharacterized protein YrrD
MKKTQEILGLPIISISDGEEVGKVKSIIINADKGSIDFILVDTGTQILSARVIPTEMVLGIGEYALTIENESSISDIDKISAAIELYQKNILVKGTKVLTKKGRLIGETGDVFVDEDRECNIVGLEFISNLTQNKVLIIPRGNVITFGKNLIVVTEDVESVLLDNPEQLGLEDSVVETEKKSPINLFDERINQTDIDDNDTDMRTEIKDIESYGIENHVEADEADNVDTAQFHIEDNKVNVEEIEKQKMGSESDAANLFEQRQRQYLNGRRATKTIARNSGDVIINEGAVITDEVIEVAKQNGKLIELVMNNKA